MSELLTAAIDRLRAMRSDTELLVNALAGAAMLAATEDARARAEINYDDQATLDAQRKTEDQMVTLQLAWRETRGLAVSIGNRLDVFRELGRSFG
ncbi:hypothetical protein CHY08_18150 [Rhizobium leguminosarum bv. viciae]|uniref:hypothetical protein n=1 Tax=Rhizobium leguminosarum TaxID=384 RepID=UPI000B8C95B3|nr:hypothetical protein [Rhizobium leguminosarum]ASR08860.1 hypothetical protein CHY08_18150 [Rhizobium leguminosarum bv. viciae]